MSTNPQKQKRATKQVRISLDWHKVLKVEAAQKGVTISKLLDGIFERRHEPEKPDGKPP
jgi:predicted HicB family RNase H-like nuclease